MINVFYRLTLPKAFKSFVLLPASNRSRSILNKSQKNKHDLPSQSVNQIDLSGPCQPQHGPMKTN